jgi:predicted nucleic acid-binding protein
LPDSALLDTGFFIRLLDSKQKLHENTRGCFKYLLDHKIYPVISTIAVAEYCVRGDMSDLPLKNLQILTFNIEHAKRAGQIARTALPARKSSLKDVQRVVIPNDSKLFAQADVEKQIKYYITSDTDSKRIYDVLNAERKLSFQFVDLHIPFKESFGLLDLPDA